MNILANIKLIFLLSNIDGYFSHCAEKSTSTNQICQNGTSPIGSSITNLAVNGLDKQFS